MPNPLILTARWLVPGDGPPIENGIVVIDGPTIVGVHPKGFATPDRDFDNTAILPGLVNAHTHLDLTGAKGLMPPTPDLTEWLDQVIAFRRSRHEEDVTADIRDGIDDSERFGVTLLGDISADGRSAELLAESGLRATVFDEIIGLTDERWNASLNRAIARPKPKTDRVLRTLSPHAPYSVNHRRLFDLTHGVARLAMHLAESAAEIEWLEHKTGPFVEFLRSKGLWQPDIVTATLPDLVHEFRRHLIIHGNFIPPALLTPAHTLVYCPRTHAAFGHPPYPLREFLASGATIALGTDSLASNPDLDTLAEARFVYERFPDIDPHVILAMITSNGAKALGFDRNGTLTTDANADLTVVPLDDRDGDVMKNLFTSDLTRPRVSFVDGIERRPKTP